MRCSPTKPNKSSVKQCNVLLACGQERGRLVAVRPSLAVTADILIFVYAFLSPATQFCFVFMMFAIVKPAAKQSSRRLVSGLSLPAFSSPSVLTKATLSLQRDFE